MECARCGGGFGLFAMLVLAGCATNQQPDLAFLYQDWANQKAGRPPLVGLPGLMGSELVNPLTGEVLWGRPAGLVRGSENLRLALPVNPGDITVPLQASTPIQSMGGVDVYEGMVETLTSMGGYTVATPSNPTPPAPCFEFAYDWRLGCEENAARLSSYLASIARSYGDPSLKVDLVAHSMGGLIARYFILYGGENVLGLSDPRPNWAGAARVRKLAMLGTPNTGSAGAVLALIHGRRVGLAKIPPDLLATMPSMFELMPPPGIPVFFTPDGRQAPLDIYDIATWKNQAWGIFDPRLTGDILRRYAVQHPKASKQEGEEYLTALRVRFEALLKRAAAFHRALHAGALPQSVQTLLLGGDCTPSLRGLVVESEGGRWVVRQRPEEVQYPVKGVSLWKIYFGPGDGHVTKASLLDEIPATATAEAHTDLPFALSGFVCAKHMNLVKNWTFRDNLLHFLLYTPLPAARGHSPDENGHILTPPDEHARYRREAASAACVRGHPVRTALEWKKARLSAGLSFLLPAATYSPTQLPAQYHRRNGA